VKCIYAVKFWDLGLKRHPVFYRCTCTCCDSRSFRSYTEEYGVDS